MSAMKSACGEYECPCHDELARLKSLPAFGEFTRLDLMWQDLVKERDALAALVAEMRGIMLYFRDSRPPHPWTDLRRVLDIQFPAAARIAEARKAIEDTAREFVACAVPFGDARGVVEAYQKHFERDVAKLAEAEKLDE